MLGVAGVTEIETKVPGDTVKVVLPLTAPSVAEITDGPAAMAVAKPLEPAALEMVDFASVAEAHVTDDVSACVVLSL